MLYYYLYQLVDLTFSVYSWMLIVRILSSWFPQLQDTKIMHFLRYYTDPYLNIFRRLIPPIGVLDISPIVAFFALRILQSMVMWVLFFR